MFCHFLECNGTMDRMEPLEKLVSTPLIISFFRNALSHSISIYLSPSPNSWKSLSFFQGDPSRVDSDQLFEFVGSLIWRADASFGPEKKLHQEFSPEDVQHFANYHEGVVQASGFGGELGDVGHQQSGSLQSIPKQVETQICFWLFPWIVDEWSRGITFQPCDEGN